MDYARAIPLLASLDIAESAAFYRTALGFHGEELGDYLIMMRDEIELHFWLCPNRQISENTSCYIRGGQVSSLFEDFEARRELIVAHKGRLSDFAVRDWNMKEFYVHDPHGNLLKFGMIPEEA